MSLGTEEAVDGSRGVVRGVRVERGCERAEEARRGHKLLPRGGGDVEDHGGGIHAHARTGGGGDLRSEQGHSAEEASSRRGEEREGPAPSARREERGRGRVDGEDRRMDGRRDRVADISDFLQQ